jgi:hypothetical protein
VILQFGGLEVGLTTLRRKNKFVMKNETGPRTWMDSLDKRPKQRNMDIRFGLWNVRSLYMFGSLMTVSKELSKYKLDLVGVQEVRRHRTCGRIHIFLQKRE